MELEVIAFFVVASVMLVLSMLLIISVGIGRLSSSVGIRRDGIPIGDRAPAWSLLDLEGAGHETPNREKWQLLFFTDLSFKEYSDAARGLSQLHGSTDVEVLLMSTVDARLTEVIARAFGLKVPIIHVSESLCRKYRVRVYPLAFILDPGGRVRSVALANRGDVLLRMRQMAGIVPTTSIRATVPNNPAG